MLLKWIFLAKNYDSLQRRKHTKNPTDEETIKSKSSQNALGKNKIKSIFTYY
jgi:hypothetical protein